MHEFWTLLFNDRRIIAPIAKPKEILDIGCGTGIWAIEVAEEVPQSHVYGIDLSPVQPLFVPDNCDFILENILRGSSFHDEKFDLIQSRCMGAGIPDHKWRVFLQEIWRLTKPGGWIQLIELDPVRYCDGGSSVPKNSPLAECERIAQRVMKDKYEITIHGAGHRLAQNVQRAGFVNVKQFDVQAPLAKKTGGKIVNDESERRSQKSDIDEVFRSITPIHKTRPSRWKARSQRRGNRRTDQSSRLRITAKRPQCILQSVRSLLYLTNNRTAVVAQRPQLRVQL